MGQITIDIPQNFELNFRIIDKDLVNDLVTNLRSGIDSSNAVDPAVVCGIWADRNESADEIARNLRGSWKRKLFNG